MKYTIIFKKVSQCMNSKKLSSFIRRRLNFICYSFGKLLPIWNHCIVFESRGDMCDNAYALFDYMMQNGYGSKYKFIWLVDDIKKAKNKNLKGVKYSSNKLNTFKPRTFYYLGRSKYYFYDHDNFIGTWKRRAGQMTFYIFHATPIKGKKNGERPIEPAAYPDFVASTSQLAAKWNSIFLGIPEERMFIKGFPRNDYFFSDLAVVKTKLSNKYKFNTFKKVFLWMPTFRQSDYKILSEDYIKSETGLPLIQTKKQIDEVNDYLRSNQSLLVLKIHPLQAGLPIFQSKYSNIVIINNDDLDDVGIQLYQFVACTDALITDYSSISIDYFLLDRPIIYTMDDFEEYKESRGFIVSNILDYLAGYHITSFEELINCMNEIISGVDRHKKDREKLVDLFHEYKNGNASERIIQSLNL